jgi:NitT/TauT family transport system substrate-binding protein
MRRLSRRMVMHGLAGIAGSAALPALISRASGKTAQLRIAYQPGLNYLPLMVLESEKLIEAHLQRNNLTAEISWLTFSSGAPMNDAMLAGQIDVASGGVTVLAVLWDKTKGRQGVKGLTALAASPFFLNTNKPSLQSLADFTEHDRIAVPTAKISPNAILLQMAAENLFGVGQSEKLESIILSMANPEAQAALLSRRTEITAHMCAPPFCFQQLQQPGIHRVLSSTDILGEGASTIVTWTTSEYMEANPGIAAAFISALQDANKLIATDTKRAAEIYKVAMSAPQPVAALAALIREPSISFSAAPMNSLRMVSFMQRVGMLKRTPEDWKDFFFSPIHALGGS